MSYQHQGTPGSFPVHPHLPAPGSMPGSMSGSIPPRDISIAHLASSMSHDDSRQPREDTTQDVALVLGAADPPSGDRHRGGRPLSPARRFFEAVTETLPSVGNAPPVVKRKFICLMCKGAPGTRGSVRASHSFQVAASVRHLLEHCRPAPEMLSLLAEAKEAVADGPKPAIKRAVSNKAAFQSKKQRSPGSDYGQAFGLWRKASGTQWAGYTRHAFIEGLCDGSLPASSFLLYLRQDYVFLVHFSRAWALAVTKAGTLSEMKPCAAMVDALLNKEMRLHVDTCSAAGISQKELESTAETPENIAYTRYVLEAGYSGDFLDLLAALAPCVLGYGEIGARLGQEATSDLYADWIASYAGLEYQSLCREVGALIDNALSRRFGSGFAALPRMKELSDRFNVATQLEIGFWNMGLR